jgi:membrane protein
MAVKSRRHSTAPSALRISTDIPWRAICVDMLRGFTRHDFLNQSAALAFFFLTSMFPFLIFLGSALALLPIHHLVERTTELVSNFVPSPSMPMVSSVLSATLHSSKGLLSIGFLGAVVFASSGFAAMIAALDVTYEVKETRSFWRVRLLAIWITFVVGGLIVLALTVMLLGPHFGRWLSNLLDVSDQFVSVWPYMRWVVILTCMLSSFELLYFWGPNARHTFKSQIPGAVFAVLLWAFSSAMLGVYIRSFSYFNSTYGVLGVFILLMLRFQLSALAILLGAELNAQLAKRGEAAVVGAAERADALAQGTTVEDSVTQSAEV